ncbi:MAG: hypothetical protein AAFP76_12685 [Bacteroidota bacterium]
MKTLRHIFLAGLLHISFISMAQFEYYVSNRAVNSINKYAESGSFLELIVEENSGGLNSPQDIVFFGDDMLISSSQTNTILRFNRSSGEFIEVWNQDAVTRPTKMSIGPDNLLYVTQWGQTQSTSTILKFNLDGTLNSILNTVIPTPLSMGHVWDDDGNFYVAFFGIGQGNGEVHKFDPDGNSLGTFIDNTFLQNPTYIWWDTNGDMLVQDFNGGKVLRYDSEGNYIEDYISGLSNPEGFGILPNGNLLVVERTINEVSEFDTNGNYLGQWDTGITLIDPNLMVRFDPTFGVEDNLLSITMVVPSVGNVFVMAPSIKERFDLINVYNYAGVLMENVDLGKSDHWNASRYAEGIYFLSAIDKAGTKFVQKIIVKR